MFALVAVPVFSLLGQPVLFEAGARAEGRTTSPAPGSPAPLQTNVLQLDGAFGVSTGSPDFLVSGAYAPRVIFYRPNIDGRDGADLLNEFRARGDYRPSRTDRILADETFVYGQQNFSPLVAAPPGQTVPPPTDPRLVPLGTLPVISSASQLEYQTATSRTSLLSARAGFTLSGGADGDAQKVLPLQKTVSAGSAMRWATNQTDRISVGANAAYSIFSNGNTSMEVGAEGTWHTQVGGPEEKGPLPALPGPGDDRARAPALLVDLSAGVTASETSGNVGQASGTWTPGLVVAGAISRNQMLGIDALNAALRASLRTTIDRLTGDYYELAEGSATVGFAPGPWLVLQTTATAAKALTGVQQEGDTLLMGEVGVAVKLGNNLTFSTGVRGAWHQPADVTGLPPGTQWAGYATVGYADRGRF